MMVDSYIYVPLRMPAVRINPRAQLLLRKRAPFTDASLLCSKKKKKRKLVLQEVGYLDVYRDIKEHLGILLASMAKKKPTKDQEN